MTEQDKAWDNIYTMLKKVTDGVNEHIDKNNKIISMYNKLTADLKQTDQRLKEQYNEITTFYHQTVPETILKSDEARNISVDCVNAGVLLSQLQNEVSKLNVKKIETLEQNLQEENTHFTKIQETQKHYHEKANESLKYYQQLFTNEKDDQLKIQKPLEELHVKNAEFFQSNKNILNEQQKIYDRLNNQLLEYSKNTAAIHQRNLKDLTELEKKIEKVEEESIKKINDLRTQIEKQEQRKQTLENEITQLNEQLNNKYRECEIIYKRRQKWINDNQGEQQDE